MADRHERDARLRARLRAADAILAPDLWPQIERRVPTSTDAGRIRRSPVRRMLVAVAALAVAGAGLFAVTRAFVGPRPEVATDLPGAGGVAFLAKAADGRSSELTLVAGAHPGLRTTVLATGLGPNADPAWSPDGTRIAFVQPLPGGRSAIVVEDVDGTGRIQLTGCCADAGPAWSSDGAAIAFVRSGMGTGGSSTDALATSIFSVPSSGGAARRVCSVTTCGRGIAELSYAPDGVTIAFSHAGLIGTGGSNDPATGIDAVGSDGSNFRHLTACPRTHCVVDVAPSWSPDGAVLAYNRGAGLGHGQRFRVMDVATGATRTLANCVVPHCPANTVPVWSPDGGSVAYATSHLPATGEPAIVVANVRTGRLTTLSTCEDHGCIVPFAVVWSPDGGMFAFVQGERSGGVLVGQAVYLLSAAGGPPLRLAVGDGVCCLAWQPTGAPPSP